MPKLFIVADQADAREISVALIGARFGDAKREAVIAALRRANPGVDLDRPRPGMVLVVPPLPDDIADRSVDPVDASLDELLERSRADVMALLAGADSAEEQRQSEGKESRAVLDSPEVRKAAARMPQLKANVAAASKRLDAEDEEAEKDAAALRESVERWIAELEALRRLRGGRG
jgi:hypothetical protein